MERQVQQLKINARNIESYLSRSNRTLRKNRQDQKKFNIRQTNIQKQKTKELKIESKRSPIKKSTNAIAGVMKKGSRGIFGMLGNVMDFLTAVVLGNMVTNIETIGSWINKIGFDKIFKSINDFINMIVEGATNLLAMAVKLPEELRKPIDDTNNKVKPLNLSTNTSDTNTSDNNISNKIDNNSLSERLFPTSERKAALEGSNIINQMFGHSIEDKKLASTATNEFSNLFAMNEMSDTSKLISSSLGSSDDLVSSLFDSNLNEEAVDHIIIMSQKILVG